MNMLPTSVVQSSVVPTSFVSTNILLMIMQILGESLPISSSGHVRLVQKISQYFGSMYQTCNAEAVDFLLHGPALVIMVWYFLPRWWRMVQHANFHPAQLLEVATYQNMVRPIIFVVIADLMTVAWWCADVSHVWWIEQYFLPIGFSVTALMLLASKFFTGSKTINWNFYDGLVLGFVQGFALLPGVSRFATTFCVAKYLGYSGRDSFALSFLIQFPLVLAAFCKVLLLQPAMLAQFFYLVPMCVMVAMTFLSYKLLCYMGFLIDHNRLWYFAGYMILPILMAIYL